MGRSICFTLLKLITAIKDGIKNNMKVQELIEKVNKSLNQ